MNKFLITLATTTTLTALAAVIVAADQALQRERLEIINNKLSRVVAQEVLKSAIAIADAQILIEREVRKAKIPNDISDLTN